MKFAISSVQGPAHKKAQPEVPRQDSATCFVINGENYIGIVSDGAGSSKKSHIASDFCVEALAKLVKRDFDEVLRLNDLGDANSKWDILSKSWFSEVREELLNHCATLEIEIADFNCTLILVIKTKNKFFSCNVGDGRAGASSGLRVFPIIVPFMTFTVGATYFLIKEEWGRFFRSYVLDAVQCDYFFVSSDGPQNYIIDQDPQLHVTENRIYEDIMPGEVYYDSNLPFRPFFEGLIDSLKELSSQVERNERLSELIQFGKYQIRGEIQILNSLIKPELDDDKSLIVFYN